MHNKDSNRDKSYEIQNVSKPIERGFQFHRINFRGVLRHHQAISEQT